MSSINPANQGTATPVTRKFNYIASNPGGAGGVLLPPARVGTIIYITNDGTQNVSVYPSPGERLINLTTNNPLTMAVQVTRMFVCSKLAVWSWV